MKASKLVLLLSSIFILLCVSVAFAQPDNINWRKFEGTTLNLLTMTRGYIDGLTMLLPEFEEKTGIKVEMEILAEPTLMSRQAVELSTFSDTYDIMYTHHDRIPQYAGAGWIEPLDKYIENSELTDEKYLQFDDFIKSTIEALTYNNKLYALPFFAGTVIMYYRKDVFAEYGIDKPPSNFDELLEVCKEIHTEDLPAIAMRGQANSLGNLWIWGSFLYGMGGHFFKDFPKDMTPTLTEPEAIKALEIFVELMQNYSIPGAANTNFDDVVIAMQQGNVAIAIEGAPLAGRILDPEQSRVVGKLGFALVPEGPAGRFPPFLAHGFVIPSGSKHKEAAWLFIQWATSPQTVLKVHLLDPIVDIAVARNSIWADEEFIKKFDFDYSAGSFVDAFRETLNIAPSWYRPAFPEWAEVGDRVALAVSEAIVGMKTPQKALADAQKDVWETLKRAGYLD